MSYKCNQLAVSDCTVCSENAVSSASLSVHLLWRALSTKTSTWRIVHKQPCVLYTAKWMSQGLIRSSMPLQLLSREADYTGHTFRQDARIFCRTPWDIRPWLSYNSHDVYGSQRHSVACRERNL